MSDYRWSTREKVMVSVVIVSALAATAYGCVLLWNRDDAAEQPKTVQEAVQVISGDKFTKLTEDRQVDYVQQTAAMVAKMPESEQDEFFDDDADQGRDEAKDMIFDAVMEERDIKRAMELAKAKTPEERNAILDRQIAQEDRMAQQWANRRGSQGRGGPGGRANRGGHGNKPPVMNDATRARARNRIVRQAQRGNMARVGLRVEYRQANDERRKETGKQPSPFGGGGR